MSKMNRSLRFFISFVLIASTVISGIIPSSAAGINFEDVQDPNMYYYDPVYWAVDKGITNGTSATEFSPQKGCSRADCVTFLYRYAGSPAADAGKASKFTDVESDSYYESAVAWAVENEITSGTSETTFSPKQMCSRAQIVTFLWRYKEKEKASETCTFKDVSSDDYYADAVSWAVEKKITNGTSGSEFSPNLTCTRAQIVTFLWRLDHPSGDLQPGTVDLGDANVGDYVTFGHYEQDNNTANGKEPIKWIVLDKKDGRVLLLSKYGLDSKPYNETNTDVTWETCTLRNWLNGSFLNEAFSSSEQAAIPTVTLSNPDNPKYGTEGGNNTNDRVFLLSLQEMQQYFTLSGMWTDYDGVNHNVTEYKNYIGGSKDVIISATAYTEAQGVRTDSNYHDAEGKESCWWWLRSSGFAGNRASIVYSGGGVDAGGSSVSNGAVRPALWVNLAS